MDRQRYDKGLAIRKEVLGTEYVETALANAGEFAGEFQELLTEYCWGGVWGDETLPRKTRSMQRCGLLGRLLSVLDGTYHNGMGHIQLL